MAHRLRHHAGLLREMRGVRMIEIIRVLERVGLTEAAKGFADYLSSQEEDPGSSEPQPTGTVGGQMAAEAPIRIVVGEDEPIVREGIVRVLEGAGFEVVGVAGDAEDLIRKAGAHKPDVVVTDIQMPPTSTDDGLEAAKKIRAARPGVGVLVLSQYLEDRYALELLGDGAEGVGYLLKDRVGDLVVFTDAVRRVAAGGSALDPQVVQRMVDRPRTEGPIDERFVESTEQGCGANAGNARRPECEDIR